MIFLVYIEGSSMTTDIVGIESLAIVFTSYIVDIIGLGYLSARSLVILDLGLLAV